MKTVKKVFVYIGIAFLIVFFGIACYIGYFVFFHNDIDRTTANVNHERIHELKIDTISLVNAWGDSMKVVSGNIVVPESRFVENSNKILINFLLIPTANPYPKSPIFFLVGGPGTPGTDLANGTYYYVFEKLSKVADIIIVDQRGTGSSIPNLRCRNELELDTDIRYNVESKLIEGIVEKCKECAEEFIQLGIDLNSYNSKESASDINDLREALHIDHISIFGYSYGSELAQQYLSMFESTVDKLVFAGAMTPDLSLKAPWDLEKQYEIMDSLIARDKKLAKYIPDFTSLMSDVHTTLREEPIEMKLPLMDAVGSNDGLFLTSIFKLFSFFKPNWELTLTETHMKMMMAQNSGVSSWSSIAPSYYYKLSKGDYKRFGNYYRNFRRQKMPNALFFSVYGSNGYDPNRWEMVSKERQNELVSHFSISFGRYPEVFDAFRLKPIAGLNAPVFSEKELLIISGTLDGRTPLSNVDTLISRFPNSQRILIHNASHNNLVDSKVLDEILLFFKNGKINNSEFTRKFSFVPPVSFEYTIQDTLSAFYQKEGVKSTLKYYEKIRDSFINQNDYYYDVSETTLNDFGYSLLNQGSVNDAIQVFRLNCELFSDEYNVYNSLAEGLIEKGDTSEAILKLKKAISLNYLDGYSHHLLHEISNQ